MAAGAAKQKKGESSMKKARKLVSLLAALVIALSCLPMTAFAADETYTIKIYSGNAPQNNYGELQALDFI